jgi:hypothetical protein
VVNAYLRPDLPKVWGEGNAVAADGTRGGLHHRGAAGTGERGGLFHRPEPGMRYRHIDALFGEPIDWQLN